MCVFCGQKDFVCDDLRYFVTTVRMLSPAWKLNTPSAFALTVTLSRADIYVPSALSVVTGVVDFGAFVNVDGVDVSSRNILDNPTRCFDFVGTDYDAEVSSEEGDEATLRLRSRDESVEGEIYLTVETSTGRPRHIAYVLYDDRIDVAVTHLAPASEAVKRYDRKAYSDYETIDFR